MVPSESACGREKTKKVSSTIMFYCNPSAGIGIPEFMLETDECQYLFVWHTDAVCGLMWATVSFFSIGKMFFLLQEKKGKKKQMCLDVFLLDFVAELLTPTTAPASLPASLPPSPGGARRWAWCWVSCCWFCLSVCSGSCSARKRGGEDRRHPTEAGELKDLENVLLISRECVFVLDRELVIQKVAGCCRRGNQVSYKYSKVGWLWRQCGRTSSATAWFNGICFFKKNAASKKKNASLNSSKIVEIYENVSLQSFFAW